MTKTSIPPFKLVAQPLNEEAKRLQKFKWAPDDIGSRHRLGGEPYFLQDREHPQCKLCHKDMTFYAQLDSINDDYIVADCGMIYVFLCFDCFEVVSFVQSG